MNKKKSKSTDAPIHRIIGKTKTLENALLLRVIAEAKQKISEPAAAVSDLNDDKNRIHIYLGDVTDPMELRKQRADFYRRIDGSYQNQSPRIDTNYAQGDYVSGMAEAILWGLVDVSPETTLQLRPTQKDVSFGYINDDDVPCGMQIVTFKLNGKSEYIISHVQDLNKPKEERQSTVFMSDGIYQFLDNKGMLSVDTIQKIDPTALDVSTVTETQVPEDLFNIIHNARLCQDLRPIFVESQKSAIQLSMCGYEGQAEKQYQAATLSTMKLTSISTLNPAALPQPSKPEQLFREAAQAQIQAAKQNQSHITEEDVKVVIDEQWASYIDHLLEKIQANKASNPPTSVISQFKEKLNAHKETTLIDNMKELQSKILTGEIVSPAEELEKVLTVMSKNTKTAQLAEEQLSESGSFNLLKECEHRHTDNVTVVNLAIDSEPGFSA